MYARMFTAFRRELIGTRRASVLSPTLHTCSTTKSPKFLFSTGFAFFRPLQCLQTV